MAISVGYFQVVSDSHHTTPRPPGNGKRGRAAPWTLALPCVPPLDTKQRLAAGAGVLTVVALVIGLSS